MQKLPLNIATHIHIYIYILSSILITRKNRNFHGGGYREREREIGVQSKLRGKSPLAVGLMIIAHLHHCMYMIDKIISAL